MTRIAIFLFICSCLTPVICFADLDGYYDDNGNILEDDGTLIDDEGNIVGTYDENGFYYFDGTYKERPKPSIWDQLIGEALYACARLDDQDACERVNKLDTLKWNQQRMEEQLARKAQQKRVKIEQKQVKIDLVVKEHGNFSAYTFNGGGRRKVWEITAHDDQDVYSFNSSGFTIRKGDEYEVYVCNCNQWYCDCRENWRR